MASWKGLSTPSEWPRKRDMTPREQLHKISTAARLIAEVARHRAEAGDNEFSAHCNAAMTHLAPVDNQILSELGLNEPQGEPCFQCSRI